MTRFTAFSFAVVLFIVSNPFAQSQVMQAPYQRTWPLPFDVSEVIKEASATLSRLIDEHPSPDVRQLRQWYLEGQIDLAIHPSLVREFGAALNHSADGKPIFLANPYFLRGVAGGDEWVYRQLCLAYTHRVIANHISGKWSLTSKNLRTETPEKQAENLWFQDWDGIRAQWALAKQLKATRLMPTFHKFVKMLQDEEAGLLEAFWEHLKRQMSGLHPGIVRQWEKIYIRERNRLHKNKLALAPVGRASFQFDKLYFIAIIVLI